MTATYELTSVTSQDVSVLLVGYNRPEYLRKRLEEILQNQPSKIFISIDGGQSKTTKKELHEITERIKNTKIDNCEINVKYQEKNIGLAKNITESINWVLSFSEYVLVIEDDITINNNYLLNIIKGLNIAAPIRDNSIVGGFAPLRKSNLKLLSNRWVETKYFSAWGWAIHRSAFQKFQLSIEDQYEHKLGESTTWENLTNYKKKIWLSRFEKVFKNPEITWDYQMQYACFINNFVNLLPLKRINDNEGFDDLRSFNTKNKRPKWMGPIETDSDLIQNKSPKLLTNYVSQFLISSTIAGDSIIKEVTPMLRTLRKALKFNSVDRSI